VALLPASGVAATPLMVLSSTSTPWATEMPAAVPGALVEPPVSITRLPRTVEPGLSAKIPITVLLSRLLSSIR